MRKVTALRMALENWLSPFIDLTIESYIHIENDKWMRMKYVRLADASPESKNILSLTKSVWKK